METGELAKSEIKHEEQRQARRWKWKVLVQKESLHLLFQNSTHTIFSAKNVICSCWHFVCVQFKIHLSNKGHYLPLLLLLLPPLCFCVVYIEIWFLRLLILNNNWRRKSYYFEGQPLCAEFWPLQWQRSALRVWKEILNSIQVGTKSNYSIWYFSPDFLLVFHIKCIRANILTISLLINWMCIKEPDIKGQTKTNHNVFFFILLF